MNKSIWKNNFICMVTQLQKTMYISTKIPTHNSLLNDNFFSQENMFSMVKSIKEKSELFNPWYATHSTKDTAHEQLDSICTRFYSKCSVPSIIDTLNALILADTVNCHLQAPPPAPPVIGQCTCKPKDTLDYKPPSWSSGSPCFEWY